MSLPQLTHLQFLVVSRILAGSASGRELREYMKDEGVRQSGPAFYQMMAALEDGGIVSGWYEQQIVDAQIIRERHYKLLAPGITAEKASREIYTRVIGNARIGTAN